MRVRFSIVALGIALGLALKVAVMLYTGDWPKSPFSTEPPPPGAIPDADGKMWG
jgi:hypothetical protein